MFDTYLNGNGDGPVGITRLAPLLNERGERIRGKRFSVSNVHGILTNTAYIEADIAVREPQLDAGDRRITPAIIAKFGDLLDHKLRGSDPKVRREYVHLLVDQVKVGDREIRITGRNAMLERAVVASQTPGAVVPKAEREWRTRLDSNQWPLPSEGNALSS